MASIDAPIVWFDVEAALLRFDPITRVVTVLRTTGSLRERILFQQSADYVLNIETVEDRMQRQSTRQQEGHKIGRKLQQYEASAVVSNDKVEEVGCFSHWSGSSSASGPAAGSGFVSHNQSTLSDEGSADVHPPRIISATSAIAPVKYFLHVHNGKKLKTMIFHSRGTVADLDKVRHVVSEILRCVYVEGPKELIAFVSPVSGSGHAQKMWEHDVLPLLYMSQHALKVIVTERQGHCEDTIADLSTPLHRGHVIIAVGGDGMVHESVNGLQRRREAMAVAGVHEDTHGIPFVATIPAGSGCALAKCFNILEPVESARAIVHLNSTLIDLLHISFIPCVHHFVPTDDEIAEAKKRKAPVPVERREMTPPIATPRFAFLNCAFAITNEIDKGSEKWRWMGNARFTVKAMQLLAKGVPLYKCKVRYLPWSDAVSGEKVQKISNEGIIDAKTFPKCTARDSCPHCIQNRTVKDDNTLLARQEKDDNTRNETTTQADSGEWLALPEDRFALLMLMNIAHAARDMAVAPLAHVGDGAIDIVYTGKCPGESDHLSRSDFVKVFLNLESGEHIDVPGMRYVKAREVEVLPEDGLVMADGELLPASGVRVKTVPNAIRIVRSF